MIKWKCLLCHAAMRTEKRPELGQRLCPNHLVQHWQRVADMYKNDDGAERHYDVAMEYLAEAKRALKEYKKQEGK